MKYSLSISIITVLLLSSTVYIFSKLMNQQKRYGEIALLSSTVLTLVVVILYKQKIISSDFTASMLSALYIYPGCVLIVISVNPAGPYYTKGFGIYAIVYYILQQYSQTYESIYFCSILYALLNVIALMILWHIEKKHYK